IEVADDRAEHAGDGHLLAQDAGCGTAPEQVDSAAGPVAQDVAQAVAVEGAVEWLLVLLGQVGVEAGGSLVAVLAEACVEAAAGASRLGVVGMAADAGER